MIALVLAAALAATTPTVTPAEYDHVTHGDTRGHVAHVFDTPGVRVVTWGGPHGWVHLLKRYPADDGTTVEVVYAHAPGGGVYRLVRKDRQS